MSNPFAYPVTREFDNAYARYPEVMSMFEGLLGEKYAARDINITEPTRQFDFANGYTGSVIPDHGATYEVAVIHEDEGLVYDTEVTDDVLRGLSVEEVNETLAQISLLPERE